MNNNKLLSLIIIWMLTHFRFFILTLKVNNIILLGFFIQIIIIPNNNLDIDPF